MLCTRFTSQNQSDENKLRQREKLKMYTECPECCMWVEVGENCLCSGVTECVCGMWLLDGELCDCSHLRCLICGKKRAYDEERREQADSFQCLWCQGEVENTWSGRVHHIEECSCASERSCECFWNEWVCF